MYKLASAEIRKNYDIKRKQTALGTYFLKSKEGEISEDMEIDPNI
jgi:hypothetical protein